MTTMVNFWPHSGGTDRHAQASDPTLASRAGKGKGISPNLWPGWPIPQSIELRG